MVIVARLVDIHLLEEITTAETAVREFCGRIPTRFHCKERSKEMKKDVTIADHIKALEKPVEVIANVRRMAELGGEDMEKFDEKLNELCEKKHEMFAKMSDVEMLLYGLKVIFEVGAENKLMEALKESEE